jgi:fructose-1,6-bisphosphatase/sedoheptulose 1,7-bisphosphatase-like protein
MLIKFESKKAASFIMQSFIAEQVLAMAGQGGKTEGSISGAAISEAIASLDKALVQQPEHLAESIDEDEEQEKISLNARAAPLRDMLQHALQTDCYVMWRPE